MKIKLTYIDIDGIKRSAWKVPEQNKPNRNCRITPDLMNCDELAIDRYTRENPGGFAAMKAAWHDWRSRPTIEDSMEEITRKVLETMTEHYSADRPGGWKFPDKYNDRVCWYHKHGLPPMRPYPWPCAKNVADVMYPINDDVVGKHYDQFMCDDIIGEAGTLNEESMRAAIEWFGEMAVDPAVKNKNKERKMDNENLTEGVPVGMGQARSTDVYSVGISRVENGFIITVGCKTFVSTNWKEAAKALGEYFEDPIAAEKKYSRKES